MTENRQKWDRSDIGVWAVLILLVFGYFVMRPWVYRTFPSTCPYASYLPNRAAVTKCNYSGFVDIKIDFEATGSRGDMDTFVSAVTSKLDEPRVEEREGGINGNEMPGHYYVHLSTNRLTDVVMIWHDGKIQMTYLDR